MLVYTWLYKAPCNSTLLKVSTTHHAKSMQWMCAHKWTKCCKTLINRINMMWTMSCNNGIVRLIAVASGDQWQQPCTKHCNNSIFMSFKIKTIKTTHPIHGFGGRNRNENGQLDAQIGTSQTDGTDDEKQQMDEFIEKHRAASSEQWLFLPLLWVNNLLVCWGAVRALKHLLSVIANYSNRLISPEHRIISVNAHASLLQSWIRCCTIRL